MTILLTGGTGKTSSRVASVLKEQGTPAIIASRSGKGLDDFPGCKFDWYDNATYGNPFALASDITAIYIVLPQLDIAEAAKAFIDYAIEKKVKRFILLTSSASEGHIPSHGAIHQYLIDKKVEYGVLQPTWFMATSVAQVLKLTGVFNAENFSEQGHLHTIRAENKFYTASGNGKIPLIASADIAAVAARLLTDPQPHNRDYLILGPELLTYDDVRNTPFLSLPPTTFARKVPPLANKHPSQAAKILSQALGREITHVNLSKQQLEQAMLGAGLPQDYAETLAGLSAGAADGSEERLSSAVKDITGKEPVRFKDFVEENKAVWA
ncbi:MAG: hypothetical protein Q9191_007675 [Dirinaria sp. TL-2023a]